MDIKIAAPKWKPQAYESIHYSAQIDFLTAFLHVTPLPDHLNGKEIPN